mgnify:FL=1|jgi:anhydro-N-acetylmuramic acid kinase
MNNPNIYLGLMSGTSIDSVDAVAVTFLDDEVLLIGSLNYEIPDSLRKDILDLSTPGIDNVKLAAETDAAVGELFAHASMSLMEKLKLAPQSIAAIGSHGQTIRHQPPSVSNGFSVQIGDPSVIAIKTDCPVVADFRRADMALGGHGAPLVPAFHHYVFNEIGKNRIIVNIGGIANITFLSSHGECAGFDTGPGNTLLDAWCKRHLGIAYDKNGQWSKQGSVSEELLNALLRHPFLNASPPKSTGKEDFNLQWLDKELEDYDLSPEDVQATLTAFTAQSIVNSICYFSIPIDDIFLCGGGAFNEELRSNIDQSLVSKNQPKTGLTSDIGIAPDWVEACAFAWLAKQRMDKRTGNMPAVTGASRKVILGGLYLP